MRDRQAVLFDELAREGCLYRYSPETLAAVNALVAEKGPTLDVGCGDGTITAALDGDFVVGCDVSPRCVILAARKGLLAVVADILSGLPFCGGAFRTVFCVGVLHHLPDWGRALSEFDRMLQPGGTLVLVEPDARNPFVRWIQSPRSPIRVAPHDNEPAVYPEELLSLLHARGYACECGPFSFEPKQVVRDVFPLWQRLLKAPIVIALALWFRRVPKVFVIRAHKGPEVPGGQCLHAMSNA